MYFVDPSYKNMHAHRHKDYVIVVENNQRKVYHLDYGKHVDELRDRIHVAFETVIANPWLTVNCNTLEVEDFKI